MKVLIVRRNPQETYTEGRCYIDGDYFCDTLEDRDRGADKAMKFDKEVGKCGGWMATDYQYIRKVYGKTAIPAGEYNLLPFFWQRFERMVAKVEKVPGFSGILIHNGTSADHSLGCILLGNRTTPGRLDGNGKFYRHLAALLMERQKKEECTIKITRSYKVEIL